MQIFQPALDPRNLYGFADPTPAAARWEWCFVTFGELVAAIAAKTGEQPRQIEHLVRAWIRDGLLPGPKIVPVPGKRGTRGDYGDDIFIGYFVIKGLRPKGKPISFMTHDPIIDGEIFSAWAEYQDRCLEWARGEYGFDAKRLMEMDQIPKPPPALAMQWGERLRRRQEQLANRKPNIRRLRLNTETLARLLPIARGERPGNIEDLYLYYQVWDEEPSEELYSKFDNLRLNASELYLLVKAVRKIWEVACEEETGIKPETLDVHRGGVIAYLGEKEVWRLSKSKWRAKP